MYCIYKANKTGEDFLIAITRMSPETYIKWLFKIDRKADDYISINSEYYATLGSTFYDGESTPDPEVYRISTSELERPHVWSILARLKGIFLNNG